MPEIDPLILSFSHLADFPRANEALHTLKKVASLVKPIMRARGWTVRQLTEFYPDQANLLGLNVGAGQKICLRLRYPGDRNQFVPLEQVVDTMLHELSHNVHGPHDAKFHALWNQLRDEHEALVMKGYTGEGFLSDGHRLGGRRLPMHEARRLARAAAEKRRTLTAGSGQRLGGVAPRPGQDIRRTIVDAIERRNKTLQGCANDNHNQAEIMEIAETATRNGFRTQAEEDAANEAAIAQALWELVQEEEKVKYGDLYIPPSAANPTGNGGGTIQPQQAPEITYDTKPKSIVKETATSSSLWTCDICTLENPLSYLCCDACGTERGTNATTKLSGKAGRSTKRPRTTVDLTKDDDEPALPSKPVSNTWTCSFCGRVRERQWWSCDLCGKIKENS